MKKILGLDLGTNSIGWAVVEMIATASNGKREERYKPIEFDGKPTKGVIVFSEGVSVDPKTSSEKSRAAERTGFRGARKLKFRRKLRKYETLKALVNGVSGKRLVPLDETALGNWRAFQIPATKKWQTFKHYPLQAEFILWLRTDNQGGKESKVDKELRKQSIKNPYYFRDLAVSKRLDWENSEEDRFSLGRAFYHLAQRRGFVSNKVGSDSDDRVGELNDQLRAKLDEIDDQLTTGELIESLKSVLGVGIGEEEQEEKDKAVKGLIKAVVKLLDPKKEVSVLQEEVTKVLDKKENLGKVKLGIRELDEEIASSNCQTLGQYFHRLYQGNRHAAENKIRGRYTHREGHYLKELNEICRIQELPDEFKDELKKAIFYQRPLRSQKGLVGKCRLQPNKSRCPVSHPDFEEFRMRQFLSNIKIQTPDDSEMRQLSGLEIERIIPKFYRLGANFKFIDLINELKKHELDTHSYSKGDGKKTTDYLFNYHDNDSVSGCPTTAQLIKVFITKGVSKVQWKPQLYNAWENKVVKDGKDQNGEQKFREKSVNEVVNDVWHCLFYADMVGDNKDISGKSRYDHLMGFTKKHLNMSEKQHEAFSKIRPLKKEYSGLSLSTIQKILPGLRGGQIYSHAVFLANLEKVVNTEIWSDDSERISLIKDLKIVIDSDGQERRESNYVNQLVSTQKQDGSSISTQSIEIWKTEVAEYLKKAIGEKTWERMSNSSKGELKQRIYSRFVEQMYLNEGRGEFVKIERLDKKVSLFLTGENELGRVYCDDERRLKHLFHPSDMELFRPVVKKDKLLLGSPVTGSIKNPMAMKTLHQLKKLVNQLLEDGVIDKNTTIRIELARELNDSNKRLAYKRWQDDLKKQREDYTKKVRELYVECGYDAEPSDDDILKYQLWEEQKQKCLYSEDEKCQIKACDFLGKDPLYDIEHTIPRSISSDNSQMNKTLCHREINRKVKRNQIPSQMDIQYRILPRIEHWKIEYEKLDNDIKGLVRQSKSAATKEEKDKIIQKRHYLSFRRDYLKGKYERFTMEEVKSGFKNSQKVDTGIITRYAQQYLRSVFERVESVNGLMVSEFRKQWGIQESHQDKFGRKHYKEKDRSNHVHHCQDAMVIACMSKQRYDLLAYAWAKEEELAEGRRDSIDSARSYIESSQPWIRENGKTFKEYVDAIASDTMIVHRWKDQIPKPIKKKVRVRGRIAYTSEFVLSADKQQIPFKGKQLTIGQLTGKTEGKDYFVAKDENSQPKYYAFVRDKDGNISYQRTPRYIQGDSARGSLHKDSYYGAIQQPLKDEDGKIEFMPDGRMKLIFNQTTGRPEVFTVIRKEIKKIKASEVDNIIDDVVREKVKSAVRSGILKITPNDNQENKVNEPVWMNEAKGVEIRKVRLYFSKNPIVIQPQAELSASRFAHKNYVYAQNEENYALAVYEGTKKDKVLRKYKIVNLLEAVKNFKVSGQYQEQQADIVPEESGGVPFKYLIQK